MKSGFYNFSNASRLFNLFPFTIFLLIFLTGCRQSLKHNPGESFEEEYDDGTLRRECRFMNMYTQSACRYHCKLYHPNGNLAEEGDFINDSVAEGWHIYYRTNGLLKAKREYLSLSPGVIYLNQVIRFTQRGDTDKQASSYYSLSFGKDTIDAGELLYARIKLEAAYFRKSYAQVKVIDEKGDEFVFISDESMSTTLHIRSLTKGVHYLHGYIEEIKPLNEHDDTLKANKRQLYFSEKYWVR